MIGDSTAIATARTARIRVFLCIRPEILTDRTPFTETPAEFTGNGRSTFNGGR